MFVNSELISDGSVNGFRFFGFGNLTEKWVKCKFSKFFKEVGQNLNPFSPGIWLPFFLYIDFLQKN